MTSGPPDLMREGLEAYFNAHQFPDTDNSDSAIHHTLGDGPGQASPGVHQHRVRAIRLNRTRAYNFAAGEIYAVVWDNYVYWDLDIFGKIPGNNRYITLKQPGLYQVNFNWEWAVLNTGNRWVGLSVHNADQAVPTLPDERWYLVPVSAAFTDGTLNYLVRATDNKRAVGLWCGTSVAVAAEPGAEKCFVTIEYKGLPTDSSILNGDWTLA